MGILAPSKIDMGEVLRQFTLLNPNAHVQMTYNATLNTFDFTTTQVVTMRLFKWLRVIEVADQYAHPDATFMANFIHDVYQAELQAALTETAIESEPQ